MLVRGIAARADAGDVRSGSGRVFVPELFGETAAGGSGGRAARGVNGWGYCQESVMKTGVACALRGLRVNDQSKRDPSAHHGGKLRKPTTSPFSAPAGSG
jgi:hypothetical protein